MNLNQPVIEALQTITVGNVIGMLVGWIIGAVIVFAVFQWINWRNR